MNDDRTHGDSSAINDGGDGEGTVAVSPRPEPEVKANDLAHALLRAICDPGHNLGDAPVMKGDRTLQEWERDAVLHVLEQGGWVLPGVPPVKQVLADGQQFSDELVLVKLVARFFRTLILGNVVITETPQAMEWLRDYIDGNHTIHGPLGKPMLWPGRLPIVCEMLRSWGFQPTPTNPQFVSLRPGGAMFPQTEDKDPKAPDRASAPIVDERENATHAALGHMLDRLTDGVRCAALDRKTVIRAMEAAFQSGALAGRAETLAELNRPSEGQDQ